MKKFVSLDEIQIDPSQPLGCVIPADFYEEIMTKDKNKRHGFLKQQAEQLNRSNTALTPISRSDGRLHFGIGMSLVSTRKVEKTLSRKGVLRKEDPKEEYEFSTTMLGKGGFGTVYEGFRKSDGVRVALKQMDIGEITTKLRIEEALFLLNARNEVGLHRIREHKNIIKLYDAFHYQQMITIVLEYMNGGNLFNLRQTGALPEVHIAWVLQNMLQALQFLHHHHTIHRDVKSDNILFDDKGNLKLADFGVASYLSKEKPMLSTIVGNKNFRSPQMNGEERSKYDGRTDIWSLGVVCLELCSALPPSTIGFDFALTETTEVTNIDEAHAEEETTLRLDEEQFSADLADMINGKMLIWSNHKRKTCGELLTHTFLKKHIDADSQNKFADYVQDKII